MKLRDLGSLIPRKDGLGSTFQATEKHQEKTILLVFPWCFYLNFRGVLF